ncbi:hypothetical protein VTL71DRAFT_12362 [Oculimacula yallundae]|uniref:Uncharacterized protein n=1 Tax=Oculimacula yallundae TaxID=86028 RepID=A0ABR4CMW1_9HELO
MSSSMASTARTLTSRTVHLKVHPTPRTFAERREVLRVIERFGEVSVFKSLKYDPRRAIHNAFLAVYNTTSSAQEIVNVSPLRYSLISESLNPSSTDAVADTTEGDAAKSIFEIKASVTSFDHHLFLTSPSKNPLHGPYIPVSLKTSYIAASLSNIVPDSNWSEGLLDWDTEKKRWRNEDVLAPEEERRYGKDGEFINADSFRARGTSSRTQNTTPRIMNGLQALWMERVEKDAEQASSRETFEDGGVEEGGSNLSELSPDTLGIPAAS